MAMMQWVQDLVEDEQAALMPAPDTTSRDEEEAAGLNFKTALNAHISWKSRLKDYINGKSAEKLDYEMVVDDLNCDLGQWIHGDGETHLGNDPIFQQLKHSHKQFHTCAGDIISEVDKGNHTHAQQLITEGNYPKTSTQVISLLAQLYIKSKNT